MTHSDAVTSHFTVLLIDDDPANLAVLSNILERRGLELMTARSGEQGLEIARAGQPDLILLDVMMPGIDGFETCRRLKGDPATRAIPVVFSTILTDLDDKLAGFRVGGVDYLTKPFQEEEVAERVGRHLDVHRLQKELQVRNAELLAKNAELDAFMHTVAHNLKNPIGQVRSMAEMLREAQGNPKRLLALSERLLPLLGQSADRMLSTVEALMLLASIDDRNKPALLKSVNVRRAAETVAALSATDIEARQAAVDIAPAPWPKAKGYLPWIEEIWRNYLSNALKYSGRPPRVQLGAEAQGDWVEYWVQDNGGGLTAKEQKSLFVPFTRLQKTSIEGHGLGLSIVQRITHHLGGEAGLESAPGEGCRFYFRLPAA